MNPVESQIFAWVLHFRRLSYKLDYRENQTGVQRLKNIQEVLGHNEYARLRFGIGNGYPRGGQVDYVLGRWTDEQQAALPPKVDNAGEIIRSFCLSGVELTMTQYNNK